LDAWEAYQRGLWHFYKYGSEENKIAQTFLRKAIALDPNFAPGHYGYSLALFWDFWLYSNRSSPEVLKTTLEEARIAVSLDDKDALAHAVLASMTTLIGEWDAGISEARTALALNPNSAFAMGWIGMALGFGGYPDEAIDPLRRAMRASPHDPLTWLWTFHTGIFQFLLKDFDAALSTMRQVLRLRPSFAHPHSYIAASLAYLGRLDEAREAWDRARAEFSEQLHTHEAQRSPWNRPEDFAFRQEGLRLAKGEPE
jgi:adenylate cyclase